MEIKAAIFDMDGTLINSLIFWDILWEKLGSTYRNDPAFRPTLDEDRQMRTMLLTDCMALVHERYAMGACAEELTDFANRLILELYTHIAKPKEGVVEFLEALRQKGIPMCVASATTAAKSGLVDDVIAPETTRENIIRALDVLSGKRVARLPKKQSNIQF